MGDCSLEVMLRCMHRPRSLAVEPIVTYTDLNAIKNKVIGL